MLKQIGFFFGLVSKIVFFVVVVVAKDEHEKKKQTNETCSWAKRIK